MKDEHLLDIQKGFNFRDLGGYKTQDGKVLKKHKVIRAAMLAGLNDYDLQYLNNYGVRIDIDFRSKAEQESMPDHVPSKAKYISDPVFPPNETAANEESSRLNDLKNDPNAGFNNMIQSYKDIVEASSAHKAYRLFFDELLANTIPEHALLFHCTTGKDRTGMGAVYFLTAVGVPFETVYADYLTSNDYILNNKALQAKKAELQSQMGKILFDNLEAMLKVSDVYLNTALDIIKKQNGTILNYLEDVLKVTPAQQAMLKQIYLEE